MHNSNPNIEYNKMTAFSIEQKKRGKPLVGNSVCLLLSLIFMCSVCTGQASNNGSEAEIKKNISTIKVKLKKLKNTLNKAYGEERVLLEKLEYQDNLINKLSKKIDDSNQQLKNIQEKISSIVAAIEQKSSIIEEQKDDIIDLLKLQVYLNHDKTLKMLLLNPDNNRSTDTKHQIKYLQNRLYKLIKEVAAQIKTLESLKTEFIKLQNQERGKQQGLLSQYDELYQQRKLRLLTLKQLKAEIAHNESESESLNRDQKRLLKLLSEIQMLLSDLPKNLGTNKSFKRLKGQMKIPVVGQYIR
ncbi:MAG TPA: hypothetical protein ENJ41_02525, partial [Oceanospirillales bacterium]|nr:hypothetical protein [Oceanospirillales bacterium]